LLAGLQRTTTGRPSGCDYASHKAIVTGINQSNLLVLFVGQRITFPQWAIQQ